MSQHVTKNNQLMVIFLLYCEVNKVMKTSCANTWIPRSNLEEVEFLTIAQGYHHLGLQHWFFLITLQSL
jgi:hypothetical protein